MTDNEMETLSQAMTRLRAVGFTSNWIAVPGGRFRSVDSDTEFDAGEAEIRHIVRFEGNSDPDDESILYALAGPYDQGLFATAFGPDTSPTDAAAAARLAPKPEGRCD